MNRRQDVGPVAEVLGSGSRIMDSSFVVTRSKRRGGGGPGLTI